MDGAGVERVLAVADAQEPGGLLERLRPEALDLLQLLPGDERAVLVAELHDVLRKLRPEARNVGQELLARGVDVHPYAVHAALDHVVQAALERGLVDIVLILPDPDRLRVDLDEFGKRVHQPAADRDRAAHGDVVVGELLARDFRRRVDRGAGLVDHHHRHIRRQVQLADESLGLAAGGAVADRDDLDPEPLAQVADRPARLARACGSPVCG